MTYVCVSAFFLQTFYSFKCLLVFRELTAKIHDYQFTFQWFLRNVRSLILVLYAIETFSFDILGTLVVIVVVFGATIALEPSSVPCCCRQIPSTSLVWLYLYPQIEKHLKNVGNTRVEMDSFVCPPVHLFVRPSVCLTICPSVLLIEWNNIKREETPRPWYKNKNI